MIICDKCPLFYDYTACSIGATPLMWDNDKFYSVENEDCPLKRIELKDGTVFVPEEKE